MVYFYVILIYPQNITEWTVLFIYIHMYLIILKSLFFTNI